MEPNFCYYGGIYNDIYSLLGFVPSTVHATYSKFSRRYLNYSTVSRYVQPKEVKLNTESQRTRHPVMILHQLCPIIKYESSDMADPGTNRKRFVVTAVINDQQFSGEGMTYIVQS